MKLFILYTLCFVATFSFGQTQYYDVTASNGNGFRFWNGNNDYKLHMGNSAEFKYGPVTDYSIKLNMNNVAGRGWTWGVAGLKPIAALNTAGDFQIARNFYVMNQVGIGTTSPEYSLHVYGGVKLRKTTIGATISNSDNSWIRDEWLTGNYGPAKWNGVTKKWVRSAGNFNDIGGIVFQDEGTYFLREKRGAKTEFSNSEFLNTAFLFAHITSGNIGIGTINPDSKLTVKGEIHSEGVIVDLSVPGPDYVFKEDYDLKPLKEVQNYIKENGHLPNIPSAKEMEANGVELGIMNMKLLEKIEELILYTIQQQKEIEELKSEIATIKSILK